MTLSSTDLQAIKDAHAADKRHWQQYRISPETQVTLFRIGTLLAHIDAYDEALNILSQSTVHSMSDLRFAATMLAEAIAESGKIDAERLAALEAERNQREQ